MLLEEAVLNPKQVSELTKVPAALVAWDMAHREYRDAGGETLSASRQVGAIMKIIPTYVRQKGIWVFEKFNGEPGELRAWLKDKAKLFGTDSYAPTAGERIVNILGNEELAQLTAKDVCSMEEMDDGELNAFVRRRFGPEPHPRQHRPVSRPTGPPPPRPTSKGQWRCTVRKLPGEGPFEQRMSETPGGAPG